MRVLKQSTAATVLIGPFLDKTDGVTEEAGLAATGTELSKAGGAFAAGPTLGTHDSDGWYPISLTTTHTNTLGDLTVKVHDAATHLPVWEHFTVLPANAYDALVSGTGVGVRADVQGWLGTAPATPTTNGVPEVDLTFIAGAAVSTSTAQLGVNVVNAAGTAWGSGAITAGVIAADAIGASELAADAVAEIADAVWDELATGHTDAGKAGEQLWTDVDAILVDTAEIGAAGAGLTAINLPDQTMNITGNITGNLSGSVGSVTGAVGSVTGAVGSVTGAVGSVTGLTASDVGAIKTQTDKMVFTVANQIDANIQSVNDVAVTGTGAAGDTWGP